MPVTFSLKPNISLGIVPTHIGFIDGLVETAHRLNNFQARGYLK
ncbi:MAG: hypothetical protein N2A42_04370 [Luteolibacter sp.]